MARFPDDSAALNPHRGKGGGSSFSRLANRTSSLMLKPLIELFFFFLRSQTTLGGIFPQVSYFFPLSLRNVKLNLLLETSGVSGISHLP